MIHKIICPCPRKNISNNISGKEESLIDQINEIMENITALNEYTSKVKEGLEMIEHDLQKLIIQEHEKNIDLEEFIEKRFENQTRLIEDFNELLKDKIEMVSA